MGQLKNLLPVPLFAEVGSQDTLFGLSFAWHMPGTEALKSLDVLSASATQQEC